METIRTLYRFFVMVVTVSIVVMGWRLYGPPASECKKFAANGVEIAQSWLSGTPRPSHPDRSAPPRLQPMNSPLAKASQASQSAPPLFASEPVLPPSRPEVVSTSPLGMPRPLPLEAPRNGASTVDHPPATTSAAVAEDFDSVRPAVENRDRLSQLFAQLAELDVEEPQLSPWGKSGRLFRFCCRASLKQSPDFSRHFESISEDPHEALEQVLAQVSAWRAAPLAAR
jgi:hypothetical protein